MKTKWLQLLLLATCLAFGTVACGSDDPDNGGGGISGSNSSGNNNPAPDAGDADASDPGDADASDPGDVSDGGDDGGPDGSLDGGSDGGDADEDTGDVGSCLPGECSADEVCIEGACVTDTAELKCGRVESLGELALDSPVTATGSLRDQSNVLTTSCGSPEGEEAIFHFTVEETAQVYFDATWMGQYDGVIEFRTDSCETPGSAMDPCFDHESRSFRAEAGSDYYMVVELSNGRPHDFTVELEAREAGCVLGEVTCTDQVLSRCNTDGSTDDYDCAGDCNGAQTSCRGDVCEEAIGVTASATYAGDNAAYESSYNFVSNASCEIEGTAVGTPGPEVVFALPGLTAGQQVIVDAQTGDNNNNAIFITSNCGRIDELTCVAQDYINESLSWTVPADGTYYVFVDKSSGAGSNFQYGIDIQ